MREDKQEGEQGSHVSRRNISELVKIMKDMVVKCRTVSKGVRLKIDRQVQMPSITGLGIQSSSCTPPH